MIEQDKNWVSLSQEDRDYYQQLYADPKTKRFIKDCIIQNFGEHNIKGIKVKTWLDVAGDYPRIWDDINELSKTIHSVAINERVANKMCATIKIETLIELGYGRTITNKEWEENSIMKYNLENIGNSITYVDDTDHYSFISFRTNELREEFMSHEENVKLVKQYFMM